MPLIRQETEGDCGVAALTLFAELPYDRGLAAVAQVAPGRDVKRLGLLNGHVVAAAAHLGITLTPTRKFALDTDEGVLRVRLERGPERGVPHGHFVAVKRGLILCPNDGLARDWRRYLKLVDARPGTLLRGAPR